MKNSALLNFKSVLFIVLLFTHIVSFSQNTIFVPELSTANEFF